MAITINGTNGLTTDNNALKFDTDVLVVDDSNNRVGVNNASPDTTMKVNFNSASTAGIAVNDTNSGNLGGMLQFYSGAGNGTLRGNIQNANNAGVHFAVGTGSITFDNTGYVSGSALDDYEEGTFDVNLLCSTTSPSTPVTTTGRYRKIGSLIFCDFQFVAVNMGGAAGAFRITGWPYAANRTVPVGTFIGHTMVTTGTSMADIAPFFVSGTQLALYGTVNNAPWSECAVNATSSGYLYCSLTYCI